MHEQKAGAGATARREGYRPLAAGFRVADERGGALIVEGPFAPPGWFAREAGDLVRSAFPGTAVAIGECFYEVVDEEPLDQGEVVRFVLHPWNDSEVMRATSELSPTACRRWAAERRELAERDRRTRRLLVLMPLVGLLPAADQLRIEREMGLPAARTTLVSAAAIGVITLPGAFFGLLATFIPGFSGAHPDLGWTETWLLPLLYFAAESWIRARLATTNGEALGSLPVVLVVGVWRALRGKVEL